MLKSMGHTSYPTPPTLLNQLKVVSNNHYAHPASQRAKFVSNRFYINDRTTEIKNIQSCPLHFIEKTLRYVY